MIGPGGDSNGGEPDSSLKAFRLAGPLFGAGIQMAAAIVAMFFFGRWLDAKYGTDPWLMMSGALIGCGAGLYSFIKTALDMSRKESENKSSEWKCKQTDQTRQQKPRLRHRHPE